jgi:uncharacterized membrane protein YtjA (UPF0391 family)
MLYWALVFECSPLALGFGGITGASAGCDLVLHLSCLFWSPLVTHFTRGPHTLKAVAAYDRPFKDLERRSKGPVRRRAAPMN